MTTFLDSRRTSIERIMEEALLGSNGPRRVSYFQHAKFDGSPAAQEIFIDGVLGNRLFLPVDSIIVGTALLTAWNITDNSAATAASSFIDFSVTNDSGTTAFTPTNLSGTDGNPIIRRTGGVGTLTLGVNDTLDALVVNFTGTASKEYLVRGHIDFVCTGLNAREYSNYYTATT
jgi:hypothetical protein